MIFAISAVILLFCGLFMAAYTNTKWMVLVGHVLFSILALALIAHLVPGFNNIKVIDHHQFSADSLPFTMYINFDKPWVAISVFLLLGLGPGRLKFKSILRSTSLSLALCSIVVVGLALATQYVKFDPKFPGLFWLWAANNLFLVCFAEEAFFRRYLQGGLILLFKNSIAGKSTALFFAALAFGLAHFKGGPAYIALATIAGVFYGLAYLRSQRIEAAILTHFLFNCLHFLFFSYPALSPS